jgi:hypothetical protein
MLLESSSPQLTSCKSYHTRSWVVACFTDEALRKQRPFSDQAMWLYGSCCTVLARTGNDTDGKAAAAAAATTVSDRQRIWKTCHCSPTAYCSSATQLGEPGGRRGSAQVSRAVAPPKGAGEPLQKGSTLPCLPRSETDANPADKARRQWTMVAAMGAAGDGSRRRKLVRRSPTSPTPKVSSRGSMTAM